MSGTAELQHDAGKPAMWHTLEQPEPLANLTILFIASSFHRHSPAITTLTEKRGAIALPACSPATREICFLFIPFNCPSPKNGMQLLEVEWYAGTVCCSSWSSFFSVFAHWTIGLLIFFHIRISFRTLKSGWRFSSLSRDCTISINRSQEGPSRTRPRYDLHFSTTS